MTGHQPGQGKHLRVDGAATRGALEQEAAEHGHVAPPEDWGSPLCQHFPTQLETDPSGKLAIATALAVVAIDDDKGPDITYSCGHSGRRGRTATLIAKVYRTPVGVVLRHTPDWKRADRVPDELWRGNGYIGLVTAPDGIEVARSFHAAAGRSADRSSSLVPRYYGI